MTTNLKLIESKAFKTVKVYAVMSISYIYNDENYIRVGEYQEGTIDSIYLYKEDAIKRGRELVRKIIEERDPFSLGDLSYELTNVIDLDKVDINFRTSLGKEYSSETDIETYLEKIAELSKLDISKLETCLRVDIYSIIEREVQRSYFDENKNI